MCISWPLPALSLSFCHRIIMFLEANLTVTIRSVIQSGELFDLFDSLEIFIPGDDNGRVR